MEVMQGVQNSKRDEEGTVGEADELEEVGGAENRISSSLTAA